MGIYGFFWLRSHFYIRLGLLEVPGFRSQSAYFLRSVGLAFGRLCPFGGLDGRPNLKRKGNRHGTINWWCREKSRWCNLSMALSSNDAGRSALPGTLILKLSGPGIMTSTGVSDFEFQNSKLP